MKERLQKIIARSGIGSRRKAEEYIRQGRVIVNGQIVTQMGTLADPAIDEITIDEIELAEPENKVYLLVHKPQGCVTSLHDPEGRKTIDQLYADIPERLYPVGRLDYDTEGLLVVTNDGMFSQLLQHPSHGIEKKYLVKVKGVPLEAALQRLRDGVVIEGRETSRSRIRLVKKSLKSSWCEVVLHEGLNRQLKKMFEFIGYPTLRIIRTTIGPLQLGRLPVGTYRFLTKAEIEAVKECGAAGAKAPARSVPKKNSARRSARPDRPVRTPRPERSRTTATTKTSSSSERSRTSVTAKSRTGSDRSRPSATAKPRTGSDRSRPSATAKPRTGSDRSRPSAKAKPRTVSSRRPKK
jgi:23S rRNA pseudouridine2605 synthase